MPNGLGQDQQSTSWPITQNFRLLFDAGTGDSPEGLIELNIKTSTHAKAETEEEGKGEENGSSSPSATWGFAISYRFFRVNVAFEGQFSPSPFPKVRHRGEVLKDEETGGKLLSFHPSYR